MKYVIFQNPHGFLEPIVFADHTTHSMVHIEGANPVSAGFVDLNGADGSVHCYGKSESLDLAPEPDDERIILSWLFNMGLYGFYKIPE